MSSLFDVCTEFEKCVTSLELQVQHSLENLPTNITDNSIAIENAKDYHYREIFNHLQEIKNHVKKIFEHNKCIENLPNRNSKIDKNYIKRQVETFQRIADVPKRERRPTVRRQDNFSLKFLETWEKILEENSKDGVLDIPKRNKSNTTRSVVSSTWEAFLDVPREDFSEVLRSKSKSFDCLLEESEVESKIDTKPRIVDVIYKKGVSGTPC